MRLSLMSAALCGVAFVPRVLSADPTGPDPSQSTNALNKDSTSSVNFGQTNFAIPSSTATTADPAPFETSDSRTDSDGSAGQASASDSTSTPTGEATAGANNLETAPTSSKKKGTNAGAIAGGVIGGLAFLALVAGILFFFLRRRRRAGARGDEVYDRSAIAVLDKSRTSSRNSHAVEPPVLAGAAPPQQVQQPAAVPAVPAAAPVPAPTQPAPEPVELHGREVDDDGVSVSSFDMQMPEERAVPRLPVYHRSTPPGGSAAVL
jgi:hypothetical protein